MARLSFPIWATWDDFGQKCQNTLILLRFRCFICHIVCSWALLGSWDIVENTRKKYFSWHSSVLSYIFIEKVSETLASNVVKTLILPKEKEFLKNILPWPHNRKNGAPLKKPLFPWFLQKISKNQKIVINAQSCLFWCLTTY